MHRQCGSDLKGIASVQGARNIPGAVNTFGSWVWATTQWLRPACPGENISCPQSNTSAPQKWHCACISLQ